MGDHWACTSSSSNDPCLSPRSLSRSTRTDLSTDLTLGLSLSTSTPHDGSSDATDICLNQSPQHYRSEFSNWPPIKPLLRSMLTKKRRQRCASTFFVKVYMEGIPIGRKLDLFALNGYDCLVQTLGNMFGTTFINPDTQVSSRNASVLTYEDKEGDWMMVGDVPWEMFLNTVKKLKIARAAKC